MSFKAVGDVIKKRTGISSISKGAMFGIGLNTWFGVSTYNDAKEKGYSTPMAVTRGVSETLIADVIGFKAYLGTQAVMGAPKLAVSSLNKLDQKSRQMNRQRLNKPFDNATFVDTQQAYTMRQAGLQLAKASKHNLQQGMMGNEASMIHM